MALRTILTDEDETLRRKSRPVTHYNERLKELVADMLETMEASRGVGLAAPQVGILRRVFVMDVDDEHGTIVAINPELINPEGRQCELEGCLSSPDYYGKVERPTKVTLRATNLEGEPFEVELEGLAAVCACHETDHLNGVLFLDKVVGELLHSSELHNGSLDRESKDPEPTVEQKAFDHVTEKRSPQADRAATKNTELDV